jgi:hypothetical protein
MPSSPCKKPCGSGKICNPTSGRCVLRKGKIGKQLLKSRSKSKSRRSKSSKRLKRSKSSKRKKLISPFLALGSDVIRYGIKPFVTAGGNCEDLTQKFGCKGPSSVFVNKKGKRIDCAWTCMSDCKPSELMSLVNYPKTITFERSDGRVDKSVVKITGYETVFSVESDDYDDQLRIWNSNEPGRAVIVEPSERAKVVSYIDATKILCHWFQEWTNKGRRIEIVSEIDLSPSHYPPHGSRIVRFEHPWIRPAKEWSFDWDGENQPHIMLEVQIDSE